MKPFLNKFLNIFHFRRQTAFFAVLGAVFVLGFLILPHSAGATIQSLVGDALAFVFGLIFKFLGGVILKFILDVLVQVAQYNGIINIDPVRNAWTTVRDIVNMFFIFAMLLIAFSTILRIHQYEAKQLLPKLVLYAILVNFSLTICGLFIDLAQVFTLTFVNAFANGAVDNFTQITGVLKYGELGATGTTNITDVLGGYMLALILLLVTIVTIGAMLLMFLVRIVYLWVLSILSPFAFVLPVVPGGQGYASQWWTMFSKQVVTAPLLAFFIWLSLTIMSQTGISNQIINKSVIEGQNLSGVASATVKGMGDGVSGSDFLINYIIAICMMFVGLMLTSQMGGAAGKIAGAASSRMQGTAMGAVNWGRRQAWRGGMYAASSPFRAAAWGAREIARRDVAREGQPHPTTGVVQRSLLSQVVERGGISGRIASGITTRARRHQFELEENAARDARRMTSTQRMMYARSRLTALTPGGRALQDAIGAIDPGSFEQGYAVNRWENLTTNQMSNLTPDAIRKLRREAIANGVALSDGTANPTPAQEAALMTFLQRNNDFEALNNQQKNRIANVMMETRPAAGAAGGWTPSGTVTPPPVIPGAPPPAPGTPPFVAGTHTAPRPGWEYRSFGEIKDSAEESPNDITSGDMVVKANQVNVTGDKAGSTLGKDLGDPMKTSGVDSLLRRGLKDGVGRLAIDFNRLGLTGAGANLVGEGKAQMIPKLLEQLRKEGRTPAELQSIEKELQKAKSLSLINKTRDKGDARKIISHEAIHDVLDDGVSVEERREMWGKMDPQKQAETEKKIRTNWAGGDKMSQDQVIEEYLANGLTNETRWGDKSPNALKLDKSVQDELRKKGVFKKMNEGLVHRMSEKEIKTPDALKTEEEFRKHNEQVAAQVSGQAIHQTLTGKAQEESGEKAAQEEEFEITGEGELEGKEEKEEEEEEKKEEKTAQAAPAYSAAEIKTVPHVQSVVKEVMESSTKGMMDPLFFRKMSAIFNKAIGTLAAKSSGAGAVQTGRLLKSIGGLKEASEHTQSENPLIRESAKQEYNIKLEEFKNEYYNAVGEDPASEDEIKDAIGDLK